VGLPAAAFPLMPPPLLPCKARDLEPVAAIDHGCRIGVWANSVPAPTRTVFRSAIHPQGRSPSSRDQRDANPTERSFRPWHTIAGVPGCVTVKAVAKVRESRINDRLFVNRVLEYKVIQNNDLCLPGNAFSLLKWRSSGLRSRPTEIAHIDCKSRHFVPSSENRAGDGRGGAHSPRGRLHRLTKDPPWHDRRPKRAPPLRGCVLTESHGAG
jgi:hypothetical protein